MVPWWLILHSLSSDEHDLGNVMTKTFFLIIDPIIRIASEIWTLFISAGFQPRREPLRKVTIFLGQMFVFFLTLLRHCYPILNELDVTGVSLASSLSCLTDFMFPIIYCCQSVQRRCNSPSQWSKSGFFPFDNKSPNWFKGFWDITQNPELSCPDICADVVID